MMCSLQLSRAVPLTILLYAGSMFDPAVAQGTADFLPGKIYVIRISPYFADLDSLASGFQQGFEENLAQDKGMLAHMQSHFHPMRKQDSGRWFLGYFHPERQEKDKVLQDMDLLVWLLHGHDVQILPIELTCSPIAPSVANSDDR